jgi:hypothetical protein
VARSDALHGLELTIPTAGLPLGCDGDGLPAHVDLLRPRGTVMVLLGPPWLAWVLTLRALGMGASVVAHTDQPRQWTNFGRWATGELGRLTTVRREAGQPSAGPEQAVGAGRGPRAVLHLWDGLTAAAAVDANTAGGFRPASLHAVTAEAAQLARPLLETADVVATARLAPAEADGVAAALRLPATWRDALAGLDDDMLLVRTAGDIRPIWVMPTPVEQRHLGAPARR